MSTIAVLGAGSWGTALSIVLADNHHDVRLWSHRKEQVDNINREKLNRQYLETQLPNNIVAYHRLEDAVKNVDAMLIVVPSKAIREVCQKIKGLFPKNIQIIHATKGIEPESLKRISEMIFEELPFLTEDQLVVLSGPSHAEEVGKRHPTTVTVASSSLDAAKDVQQLFSNEFFRVYTSEDVVGIELGGALKNIIALGAGLSDGLGYGDNAKAALITRGLAEITRLGVSLGANPLSFLGLSGVGDLIVTSTSIHSRNWRAGNLLGKGKQLVQILDEMGMVVEGVRTTKAAYQLAKKQNIDMPITFGLYEVLFNDKDPRLIVEQLMKRSMREEMDDLSRYVDLNK